MTTSKPDNPELRAANAADETSVITEDGEHVRGGIGVKEPVGV